MRLGQGRLPFQQRLVEPLAAAGRHHHVAEHQVEGALGLQPGEPLVHPGGHLHAVAGLQQPPDRGEDSRARRPPAGAAAWGLRGGPGRAASRRAPEPRRGPAPPPPGSPGPAWLSSRRSPPRLTTRPLDTASPRPVPLPNGLVVKKGSNTLRSTSGSMPAPLSSTTSRTRSPSISARSTTRPSARWSGMAWTALTTRLTSTCTSTALLAGDVESLGEQVGEGHPLAQARPRGLERVVAERAGPPPPRSARGRAARRPASSSCRTMEVMRLHRLERLLDGVAAGPREGLGLGLAQVLEVGAHHRRRVVDLVGDPGRELAQGSQLLGPVERLLGPAQLRRPLGHLVLQRAPQGGERAGVGHQPGGHGVADRGDGHQERKVDQVGGAQRPGGDQGVVAPHGEEHADRRELDAGVRDAEHVGLPQPVEGDDQHAQQDRPGGVAGRGHDRAPVGDGQRLEDVDADAAGNEGGGEDPDDGHHPEQQLEDLVEPGARAADHHAGVAEPGGRVEGRGGDLEAGADLHRAVAQDRGGGGDVEECVDGDRQGGQGEVALVAPAWSPREEPGQDRHEAGDARGEERDAGWQRHTVGVAVPSRSERPEGKNSLRDRPFVTTRRICHVLRAPRARCPRPKAQEP